MQQYQHNINLNQPDHGQQPNVYQPDQIQDKKVKNNFWGYFLTSVVSVILTVAMILGILISFKGKELFSNAQVNKEFFPKKSQIINVKENEDGNDELSLVFKNTPANKKSLEKLETIFSILQNDYYEELSENQLIDAMAIGMVEQLESPYTFYMTPEYVEEMEDLMSGEYSGIGAVVEQVGASYQISDIIEDSPAEKSGLMVNDVFVSVDGKDASEFEDVAILALNIRGEQGTKVVIEIYRASDNKNYKFEITRANITNANIRSEMLTDDIGYVRILEFSDGAADNFITAMDNLQDQGAKNIVFDLRNNGGGYIDEVLYMLDYLLSEGELTTEIGRRNGQEFEITEFSDKETGVPEDMKFACIMNNNSASASELFAGCLRDWNKAELVGETSFGKGVGTITQYLEDGSAVQITNFYYNLPSGTNIDGTGLTPDYEVELPENIRNMIISRIDSKEDTQLQKAIEILE
ncbi:MAG TPA: S41 family peptidase [Clostridiaceae bacterium]|nr:S41 family peptidase [Clostridiaceae bacterium]